MTPDRETIRAILDLFQVEASTDGFYFNECNDYGRITLDLFVKGDPVRFAGEKVMGEYVTKDDKLDTRWTGRYTLNDALVDELVRKIEERKK